MSFFFKALSDSRLVKKYRVGQESSATISQSKVRGSCCWEMLNFLWFWRGAQSRLEKKGPFSEQTGGKGPFLRALSGNPCMKLLSSHLKTSVPASGKDVPFHVKRTVVQIRRQWSKFIPSVTSCCIPKRNATYARISTLSLLPVLRGLTAFLWKWGA